KALLEAGVDVILIETSQDILQTKISIAAAFDAMAATGKRVPVQAQVTLQESGTMLLGTEISAALAILDAYDVDIVGLNCATGPREMNDAVRYLCHNTSKNVSVLPNAGLPHTEGVGGLSQAVYRGVRSPCCRWLLRDNAAAHRSCRASVRCAQAGIKKRKAALRGVERICIGATGNRWSA